MSMFFEAWDQGAYNSVFFASASPFVQEQPEIYKGAYIEREYGKVATPSKMQNLLPSSGRRRKALWKVSDFD